MCLSYCAAACVACCGWREGLPDREVGAIPCARERPRPNVAIQQLSFCRNQDTHARGCTVVHDGFSLTGAVGGTARKLCSALIPDTRIRGYADTEQALLVYAPRVLPRADESVGKQRGWRGGQSFRCLMITASAERSVRGPDGDSQGQAGRRGTSLQYCLPLSRTGGNDGVRQSNVAQRRPVSPVRIDRFIARGSYSCGNWGGLPSPPHLIPTLQCPVTAGVVFLIVRRDTAQKPEEGPKVTLPMPNRIGWCQVQYHGLINRP